ncbi:hypothetical protein [Streptomyces sp. NPDC048665]|uniref:hypothetical protein n=1 Tax=Streptomyces sp. NPDC048665 TaxID=3155490 RepID=UPI00341748EA
MAEVDDDDRAAAAKIASPWSCIEWSSFDPLQCLIEDVPHDHHAAFLRTGARAGPDSDVYLCWCDGSSTQWLEDLECCMHRPDPLGTGCTIFTGHPGRCDWQYIDPEQVAAQAQADQLIKAWGLSHLFKSPD